MKEIIKTKLVEQTDIVFVADDGREFYGEDAEYRCKIYEKKQNKADIERRYEGLDKILLDIPFADYDGLETTIYLLNVRDSKDLETVADYGQIIECVDVSDVEYVEQHTFAYPCKKVMLLTCDSILVCDTDFRQMYLDLSNAALKVMQFYTDKEEK